MRKGSTRTRWYCEVVEMGWEEWDSVGRMAALDAARGKWLW
jgi:hypothetical protein